MNEERYIQRAIELASRGLGHTRPNPAVGAVIVKNGAIVGEGWHRKAGEDHAEVAAIKNALRKNRSDSSLLKGSTIYVTLEPCSKVGRVGACTDAIASAGISRVVYVAADPNPLNRGKARRALAKHGVKCERFRRSKPLMKECDDLIKCFRKHVLTGLPYVTVKIAMSLDGKICDNWGHADWISNSRSRKLTNRMRENVDVIMVGAETVRKDDPSLLARVQPNKDLVRAVVSKSGRLPKDAQVFTDGKNPTLVFNDARTAVVELGKKGFASVLCEGGLDLARSLAEEGLVDEWLAVMAPVVIGNRPISKAIRASTIQDKCVFVDGDMFIRTRLV